MHKLKLSDLPENLRIKLTQSGRRELWHRVNEFRGAKNLAEEFDYSKSKIYNWKSKHLALPIDFVRQIMAENNNEEIILLKGPSSSGKIKNPQFPLKVSDELMTRVKFSVKENFEGTPVYITPEKSLAERFGELLENLGKFEYKVYSRDSRFELRYPKFLHEIFLDINFEEDLGALVDETGEIQDGKILLKDRKIPVEDFDKEIFSREKRFELALERGDSEKIADMMVEESERVRSLIGD
jgi:hypothetical protein